MSTDPSTRADIDMATDGEVRKPWAKPQVITASVAKNTLSTFKLTPTLTDYTTGSSHIGS
ncbi:MAG TPA: hypothetical protein VG387_02020 [Rhizomicrobium sp.]|jgi:hypothetical protein|nr:hypothetical protein [Rhizomicrobium sp.]